MNTVQHILSELNHFAEAIDQGEIDTIVQKLITAKQQGKRIFLAGAGRSGCVVKAFTNRLMHVGFTCYLVGDITTPPIQQGDILFLLSGSGKTTSLVNMARKAKEVQASILTITLQKEGDIAQMSDALILLPGTTRLQNNPTCTSIQPVGSCFEQLSFLTCDGIILQLRDQLHMQNEDMLKHHANLE